MIEIRRVLCPVDFPTELGAPSPARSRSHDAPFPAQLWASATGTPGRAAQVSDVSVPAWPSRQDLEQHVWTHSEVPRKRPVMGGDQHD